MSSFFSTRSEGDAAAEDAIVRPDPWMLALGVLAGVLVLGGVVTAWIGLGVVHEFGNTVLGQDQRFDGAVATAITGGAAIALGILVGACWLVLGAIRSGRR